MLHFDKSQQSKIKFGPLTRKRYLATFNANF